MLYSKNGSYPEPLPHRIVLSDGTTRTDKTTFTEEEIASSGYVLADPKPNASYPNVIDWDGNDWLVREPNDNELFKRWEYVKEYCVQELEKTDYKVIKAIEQGIPVEPEYVEYRQALRDLYNNVNNVDPWFVEFPSLYQDDEEIIQES